MSSQADAILLYLESGADITALEALDLFGCLRLAARIKDLRGRGIAIQTHRRESGGKVYAAYRLARPVQHSLFAQFTETRVGRSSLVMDANI